jgi:cytidylate kinase
MEIIVPLLTPKQNWMNGTNRGRGSGSTHLNVSTALNTKYVHASLIYCMLSLRAAAGTESVSSVSSRSESVTPTDLVVEKSTLVNNGTKLDFSSSIRAEVVKEHKDTVLGLEVRGRSVCWGGR